MSLAQITAFQPRATSLCSNRNLAHEFPAKSKLVNFGLSSHRAQFLAALSLKLERSSRHFTPILKFRRSSIVCLSKSGGENEGAPWKSFEKALGDLTKRQSIEDVLKQQIQKKEFYEDKDDGGGPPGGGSRGGGGGGSDGLSGPEDEGVWNELVQVVLATIGFIFLYTYIITGEELIKLFKDYIKYVLKGTESNRLKVVMNKWRNLCGALTAKKPEEDPYWLEKEILRTETWYDCPEKDNIIYDKIWEEQQKALGLASSSKSKSESYDDSKSKSESYDDSKLNDDCYLADDEDDDL